MDSDSKFLNKRNNLGSECKLFIKLKILALVSTYLQNLVQDPSQESNKSELSTKVENVIGKTNKVEKHLDLLQDHVIDVASLVGIDPDNFMNFHGTDEDRETLLSIMNNNNGTSSLDEIPFTVPESTEKYDTFLGDLGEDPLQANLEDVLDESQDESIDRQLFS